MLINEAIDDLPYSMYGADARLARTADRLFLSYCKEASAQVMIFVMSVILEEIS
jgi:hypothetical protein